MDLDSIECVSSSDGLDEDEIHQHHHTILPHPHPNLHQHHPEFSSSKSRTNGANNTTIAGPNAITPATSVHELLECPVCTNSMYPPIHQVYSLSLPLPLRWFVNCYFESFLILAFIHILFSSEFGALFRYWYFVARHLFDDLMGLRWV